MRRSLAATVTGLVALVAVGCGSGGGGVDEQRLVALQQGILALQEDLARVQRQIEATPTPTPTRPARAAASTPSPTVTAAPASTVLATLTPTAAPSPGALLATPTPTPSPSPTPSPTPTPTPTATPTPSPTPTATRSPTPTPTSTPTPTPTPSGRWTTIATWRQEWVGTGAKDTQSFAIRYNEWRVTWIVLTLNIADTLRAVGIDWRTYDPEALCAELNRRAGAFASERGGSLSVYVYLAKESKQLTQAAGHSGWGCDTAYVRTEPGDYYLRISSSGVLWVVIAQDRR